MTPTGLSPECRRCCLKSKFHDNPDFAPPDFHPTTNRQWWLSTLEGRATAPSRRALRKPVVQGVQYRTPLQNIVARGNRIMGVRQLPTVLHPKVASWARNAKNVRYFCHTRCAIVEYHTGWRRHRLQWGAHSCQTIDGAKIVQACQRRWSP